MTAEKKAQASAPVTDEQIEDALDKTDEIAYLKDRVAVFRALLSAQPAAPSNSVTISRELLHLSVNGYEQEQGVARNEIRDMLAALPAAPAAADAAQASLVDDALAKVGGLGTIGAMKWLAEECARKAGAGQAANSRGTSDQIQMERELTCNAIDGAIAFGMQGNNEPPSDGHWLSPYWKIGRQLAAAPAAVPQDAEEDAFVINRLGQILAGVCIALKGPELELHRHSYHDIVDVATALKLELDLFRAQAAVPQGWKMVPVEPTDAMQAVGPAAIRFDTTILNKMWTANAVYRAMITAAPTPPAAPSSEADAKDAQELTVAARDVLAERQRQLKEVAPEDDDQCVCDELAALACVYAMPSAAREWDATSTGYGETLRDAMLPPEWRFTPGDRREELRKAGGLILAEMERIDRAAIAAQAKERT